MIESIILATGGGLGIGAVLGVAVIRPCLCRLHAQVEANRQARTPRTAAASAAPVWTTDEVRVLVDQARNQGEVNGSATARIEALAQFGHQSGALRMPATAREIEEGS